ncbi:MAG: winged helix-turn-helix transcriptional regulator [Spirulina sp.]
MECHIPEPAIYDRDCPTRQVLEVIGDKWSVILLYALAYGTKRYSELDRRIDGISQKVLTQTLRSLERHGLVHRQVYPEVPPRVEYSLTSLGESLIDPLLSLANWSRTNFTEVLDRRDRYDRGQ